MFPLIVDANLTERSSSLRKNHKGNGKEEYVAEKVDDKSLYRHSDIERCRGGKL